MSTVRYIATVNTPGYLPMDDDPPVFDTAREAWQWLAEQRERDEDEVVETDGLDYSQTVDDLRANCAPQRVVLEDVVYGSTPGYDGDHDLGLAYCVSIAEERYRHIVYLQDDEADVVLSDLCDIDGVVVHGATAESIARAIEHLKQWDYGDADEVSDEAQISASDTAVWSDDGRYLLTYSVGLRYVALQAATS